MIGLLRSPWAILAVAALVAAAGWRLEAWGYQRGRAAAEAAHAAATRALQERLDAAEAQMARAAQEIAAGRRARERLAQEIEDEARRDVDPARVPGADSLRRLRSRWGDDPTR